MDIDHIDGGECLVFLPGEATLRLLREMRNREVFNRLLTERKGVGLSRREALAYALPSPSTLRQLESFRLIDWSIDYGQFEMKTSYVVTERGNDLLRAEDVLEPGNQIIVFHDRVEIREY